MGNIPIKPLRSEVYYFGSYTTLAFGLLANPIPLYQNLIKHLGKYGVTIKELGYESPNLADSNVICNSLNLNSVIRVRLDGLSISFLKLHELGETTANNIVRDSWAAIHETDAAISLLEHRITLSVFAQLHGTSGDNVIQQYVAIPKSLGDKARSGVFFYLPEDLAKGEKQGNVVLDRVVGQEQQLFLKFTVLLDAKIVDMKSLELQTKSYIQRCLGQIGLEIEGGTR